METELIKKIKDNYGLEIINVQVLSGGWMNKKYLVTTIDNKKYVVKLFSPEKVKKMSKGEFSADYLDEQLANNLKIENYMYGNCLNCEKINLTHDNKLVFVYNRYRVAIIDYISGIYVPREYISNEQLYKLGQECAKMHLLFKNVDSSKYIGEYLKLPSIEKLFNNYQNKISNKIGEVSDEYLELLSLQGEGLKWLKDKNIINEIPIAVTHGDFADDNILFDGEIPYILDFELVRVNSPLLDVGRIIMSYCFEYHCINYDKMNSFILGYSKELSIRDNDIFLSLITVWINEVDMWIKENYFNKPLTKKAKRFQDELIYLTNNLIPIIEQYKNGGNLKDFCDNKSKQRRLLK